MPKGPAARILDPVIHPAPGMLTPGPGSPNVLIGGKLAWRGVPAGAAAAISTAKAASDKVIQAAEAATALAAGTPGLPAAKAAEETAKSTAAATMGSMITGMAGGADIHACTTPLPIPPHGPGVVIDGSPTVLINGLPACRQGDTIIEAVGPPDKIAMGLPTVIIGDVPGPAGGGGALAAPAGAAAAPAAAGKGGAPGANDPTSEPLIAKSPTLTKQLEDLKKDGWKIEFWDGPGSDCSKGSKTIRVDKRDKGNPKGLVQTLAHEAGHASYKGKVDESSRQAYIDSNLADEGAATLNNVKVQREIKNSDGKNGGPDIGIAGNSANAPKYEKAYEDYLKDGDEAKAGKAMGDVFADGEKTSTTNQTYREYYGGSYDKRHPAAGTPNTGTPSGGTPDAGQK
jgi:uncharacterized Zn-binding protein involved in type VI secretion